MSKAKFRSRKIDFKRPLPVYRATDLPGLEDASTLQRTAPIVETGVEKEEEEEHHLQAVISAAQAAVSGHGEKVAPLYIPTPDASRSVADYDKFYRPRFAQPTSHIRFTGPVEEAMGCTYCMDEEDEEWLNTFNKGRKGGQQVSEDAFEAVMAQYERLTRDMVFTTPDDIPSFADLDRRAQELLMPLDPHANLFYEHWKDRRVAHEYKPLMPILKFEDGTRNSESDPYICFRRREVKQLRKTRRTDVHSMERLRKLQLELESARSLLEMVAKREKMRKESLVLEQIIFKQKCTVLDHRREAGHARDENDDLFGTKRKARKFAVNPAGPGYEMGKHTITIPLRKLKDYRDSASPTAAAHPAAGPRVSFVVPPKVAPTMTERAHREMQRRKALNDGWVDTTANPYTPFPSTYPHTFYQPLPTKSCLANVSAHLYHPYRVLPVTAEPD
ncbi:Enhancer of polycomb-like protein 1, partial [Dimargaris xerosporica]